jgi:hypothetical protein
VSSEQGPGARKNKTYPAALFTENSSKFQIPSLKTGTPEFFSQTVSYSLLPLITDH